MTTMISIGGAAHTMEEWNALLGEVSSIQGRPRLRNKVPPAALENPAIREALDRSKRNRELLDERASANRGSPSQAAATDGERRAVDIGSMSPDDKARFRAASDANEAAYQAWKSGRTPPPQRVLDVGKALLGGRAYEEYTPDDLARLRDQDGGEESYQALRANWIARGKPRRGA